MSKKSYTGLPEVPPELHARYETVMAVVSGSLTVSDGAKRLGLSRNRFQSLVHRAMASMIEELGPKAGGRPPLPAREKQLEMEAGKLRLQNERLARKVETAERILGVASGFLQGRAERGRRRDPAQKKPDAEDE